MENENKPYIDPTLPEPEEQFTALSDYSEYDYKLDKRIHIKGVNADESATDRPTSPVDSE